MELNGSRFRNALVSLIHEKWTERVVYFVFVPALLLYSLWLPPMSIGARLFHLDYPLVSPQEGGVVIGPDGAQLVVPPDAVSKRLRMRINVSDNVPAETKGDKDAPQPEEELPTYLVARSPIFQFDMRGDAPTQASLSLPVPYNLAALNMLDLFGWDGEAWKWLPSHLSLDGLSLHSDLGEVPSLVMIGQSQPTSLRISYGCSNVEEAKADTEVAPQYITLNGVTLDDRGDLNGELPSEKALATLKGGSVILSISNLVNGVVRSDWVDNLIIHAESRERHIQNILSLLKAEEYAGVEIAYADVHAGLRAEFSGFIGELSQALHEAGKVLAVRVDSPLQTGATWDTGAYDWQALGKAVDIFRLPAAQNLEAYTPDGEMDKLIAWATGEVDRRKIGLSIPTFSHDLVGEVQEEISYQDALFLLTENISTNAPDGMVLPGKSVDLNLPSVEQSPLEFHEDAQVYWFTHEDEAARMHTILLENASSVACKMQYVTDYALGGVSLEGALNKENDPYLDQVLQTLQTNLVSPEPDFAVVWTVEDAAGQLVAQEIAPLDAAGLSWTAPNNPGNYIIRADLSTDGGETSLGASSELDLQVPTLTPTPTPTPTNTPTPTATPTLTPTPKPTAKPQSQAVAAVAGGGGSAAGYFGYGIQADLITDGNHERIFQHIQALGFNWVKQQVEWFRYNPGPGQYDWGPLDRIVDGANAHGINVLFSVVKSPKWAEPPGYTEPGPPVDPNTYGTFLREMAARYKGRVKAYEIWNEQNLYYEWGGHGNRLNAAQYVELLKVAYNAIKSVDPAAIVVSGAPTPTGVSDGDTAIRDTIYLEQMYQAGMRGYCDAVGVHPSGFNNPPDATFGNWSDPSAPSFKNDPQFYYRNTMESYRNIMIKYGDGNKRLWPTEFGWASVDGLGVPPVTGYEYSADNTQDEQAQYIVRAYQMARNWGFVGPMFLWNLNFGPVSGKYDEKAAFGIVRDDWGARPAFAALRDMAQMSS